VSTPYEGLRVVEIAFDPAGEMVGLQLANMGANVTKVEPPGGAPSRHRGPYVGDHVDPDASLAFWYYNTSKHSVVVDLGTPGGAAALDALVADADVVVVSGDVRDLRSAGIDPDAMGRDHGDAIVVSITPFGLTGPWAEYLGSDLVLLAASGLAIMSGYDDHDVPPIRPGGDQAFHTAASFAHIALLLALLDRDANAQGTVIDVSAQEACGVTVELANPFWFYPRTLVRRQTCRHAQPVPTQPALFACGDGRYVYFALILSDAKPWRVLVEWLDEHDLATDLTDAAYDELAHRQANFAHVQDVVECFFLLQDSSYAYHEGQRRGLPIGVLNAPEDLFDDEHLRARGFFRSVDHPGHGPVLHPGAVLWLSGYDHAPATAAPPLPRQ
jgi:crotonobetainyl-CoA:carnitine CoA-transferase CaiB-like acyl-CoA transferase